MTSAQPKLLVVDDDAANILTMRDVVEPLGVEVIEACDGEQALSKVLHHDFFLILMDVQMREDQGFQTADFIFENRRTAKIPIIFVTVIGTEERYVHERYSSGPVDYIYKPLDSHVLGGKISVFMGLWQQREELLRANSELALLNRKLADTGAALARSNEDLSYQALHDALTGLVNRTYFCNSLGNALSRCRRSGQHLGVLFIDLDNFKGINDTLGHDAGDELLKVMAQRLARAVRSSDLVARFGGDEFAILLEHTSGDLTTTRIADNVLNVLSMPVPLRGQEFHLSASIGIALYPGCGPNVDELMKCADIAMYQAKKDGRNNYRFYSEDLQSLAVNQARLHNELKAALDHNMLEVYYQPQVTMPSEEIYGVEALVRWNHPDRGLLSAAEFIPVAEQTGLISQLGEWVFLTACQQLKQWMDAGLTGPDFTMAINVSAKEIHQAGLVERIARVIEEVGIQARQIELEITETVLIDDLELCARVLQKIADLGVKIAIDDFGAGYASYQHLQRLPIHTLKIDRSFVENLANNPKDEEIVKSMIHMSKALDMKVTAEGVEDAEQADVLRCCDCDLLQGYYFSKPLPVGALENLLSCQ